MKNLLIFLFGVGCGVGGTMLYLRKEIKKELEEIRRDTESQTEKNDIPFTVNDSENTENERVEYYKLVSNKEPPKVTTIEKRKNGPKNVKKSDTLEQKSDTLEQKSDTLEQKSDTLEDKSGTLKNDNDETDGGIYEIDTGEFMHNHGYGKDRLVYYRGDLIMSTENGTIIANPFPLVGGEWERCVGTYAENTAFIRNTRLNCDYEIYVENGLYEDEFGNENNFKD